MYVRTANSTVCYLPSPMHVQDQLHFTSSLISLPSSTGICCTAGIKMSEHCRYWVWQAIQLSPILANIGQYLIPQYQYLVLTLATTDFYCQHNCHPCSHCWAVSSKLAQNDKTDTRQLWNCSSGNTWQECTISQLTSPINTKARSLKK